MFNNYNVDHSQSIEINAVSGTIVKNYKDSLIVRFHMESEMAKTMLYINPRNDKYKEPNLSGNPVVILQVMLCGEKEFLVEFMWKKDFEKLFGNREPGVSHWVVDDMYMYESGSRKTYNYTVHCKKCGYKWDYSTDIEDSRVSDYCPNCGADMTGDDTND